MTNVFCPVNIAHQLSADAEVNMYYCYSCAKHYHIRQLRELECDYEGHYVAKEQSR